MKKVIFFVCLFAFLFAQEAQTENVQQEESKQKSTSEVILTEEDFKLHNCENVGDALQTITGVFISSTGEIGLRDVSSSKVVVILDGQRLNTAGGTGVNISSMPIENVETIELLRGGRSAQYGADAVGGVIVVNSKKGLQDTQKSKKAFYGVRLAAGSYGKIMANLNNSLSLGKFSSFISYQFDRSKDNFIYEYLNYGSYNIPLDTVENNQKLSNNVFVKLDYNIDEKQNMSASFNHYNANNGTPGMIENPTPNAVLQFNNQSYNVAYSNMDVFRGFSLKGQGYFLDNETKFSDPDDVFSEPSDHDNYALGLELSQNGNLFNELLNLNYGYSFRNDRIVSTNVGRKTRNTNSAFGALTAVKDFDFFISRIEAALAARFDAPSDFASAFSPRFSFAMSHIAEKYSVDLKTHITRSYKAPTFNDLYWPQDAYSVGNPNLQPEYGFNYDIGLSMNLNNFMMSTNFFSNDVTNLILWQQDPALNNLWTPKNISKTSTKGLETSMTLTLWKVWGLNFEHTFMRALDIGPDVNRYGKFLIYKPRNKFDINSSLKIAGIEWNLNYHFIDYRYTDAANVKWLPAYGTMDSNVSYTFMAGNISMNVIGEVNNIFNTPVMLTAGTAEAGRVMKLTLGANF